MPARPLNLTLLAVAAPAEARAVLRALGADEQLAEQHWHPHPVSPRFTVLITGIGKANAAAALARALDPERHAAVISVGVAGALPGSNLQLGAAVAATACLYADEGLQTPAGFQDCAAMGFPLGPWPGPSIPVDAALLAQLREVADAAGPIATVSTCSGTDALAEQVRRRTGAVAESMEGAAIAHVAARLGVPAGELRIISNTCGDRPAQRWDLPGALARLQAIIGLLGARGLGERRTP
jgi:futalosine hydrolase